MKNMIFRKYPVKKEVLFAVGSFSMAASIILGRFGGVNPMVDFLTGLLTGLSLTLNLGFLIKWRMERNENIQLKSGEVKTKNVIL